MKKRFLACGLCALMLLSAVRASAVRGEDVFHDDSVVRSVTTVVYCLSEDRYRLVPEVRTIQILGGETLLSVLANDPRPRYQDDPQRVYGMAYGGRNVRFRVEGDVLTVLGVEERL